MKNPQNRLVTTSLLIGAIVSAGLSTASADHNNGRPVVITPPAIKDGSNFSRAPYPAARQFDDTKAPDGQAIDKNPASNLEPAIPPARIAILQRKTAPTTYATVSTEPTLAPTGRSSAEFSAPAATVTTQTNTNTQPVMITPPAVKDGSNASRAPIPAKRDFDDTKAPNGQAVDQKPSTP